MTDNKNIHSQTCSCCGGELAPCDDGKLKCIYCGTIFEPDVKDSAEDEVKTSFSQAFKKIYDIVNPGEGSHGKRLVNKWIALILCFLGGFLGLHKFYEGKIALGILYLLTGGLFLIGCIVDFFKIWFKSDTYEVRK